MKTPYSSPPPALWELEIQVMDVISERQGNPRESIHAQHRIMEDLGIDSLDLVELLMALEDRFDVSIPEDIGKRMFVRSPLTVSTLAEIVHHQWGTGKPVRKTLPPETPLPAATAYLPFTQFSGKFRGGTGMLLRPLAPMMDRYPQFQRRTDGMRCIQIPGAELELGTDAPGGDADESPRHRVVLVDFLIDAEPVSAMAYARFLNALGAESDPWIVEWLCVDPGDRRTQQLQIFRNQRGRWAAIPGTEFQPMILVSWYGAAAYSLWAAGRDWRAFHLESFLPSEAQWEYAARGTECRRFPWGDGGWSPELARAELHRPRQIHSVPLPMADVHERLGMSPFGLHHMAGNVWQWCEDWYDPHFYRSPAAGTRNAVQKTPTGIRSERGGSWVGPASLCRSSYRRGRPPVAMGRCLGFRCRLPLDLPRA